ncbi:restriction endonuclease S subunit [Lewinella antarctica]|uniref:Restriction endonuclease S subunit n=1 Tax=Neolewinella antarctica TaxID=442734 RepID=A0ABX0XFE4_9BACT|nr:restriction endonuclease S subunit [Neolewinella antarctica]
MKRYFYNLPTLPEQQKIATFLGLVDRRLAVARRRGALLEIRKNILIREVFEPSATWSNIKLSDISLIRKGKGISKSDIVNNGSLPCIRYGELYTTYGEVIDEVFSSTNIPGSQLILSEGNEVLIPASGETAIDIATAACVIRKGIALGSDMNIIKTEIDGRFLAYQLSGPLKLELAKLAQSVSVMHIYGKQLEELMIRVPNEST